MVGLFWVIQLNSKCPHKDGHKREAEGEDSVAREVDPGMATTGQRMSAATRR